MKIRRLAVLLACIACRFSADSIALCRAADDVASPDAPRPAVHNVLRGGAVQPTGAESASQAAAGEKASPTVAQAGPALGAPSPATKKTAATPKPAAKDAAEPRPAATSDAVPNVLRDAAPKPAVAEKVDAAATVKPTPTPTPTPKTDIVETAPRQAERAAPGGRTAVVSDSAAARSPAERPNLLLNADGEESGKKAEVSKQPVDAQTQKMFESNEALPPLTPELELLRKRVQTTLATFYHNWTLNTTEHSPWEVMHAIIAYGVDTRLVHQGKYTTAIGHLCFSGISNKLPIVTLRNNELYVLRGPGVQGHSGQFLAILAQSHLQRDYPLYVGGKQYTLEDLIEAEKLDCESGTELTFKLIGLMHYLPSDAKWTNFQGQPWTIDRLVREEIVQPVRGAACGGTHRLMGLSYAVQKREQRGQPIDGIYREAEKYIDQYHKYTLGMQNTDGSFSTAWFVRREARLDLDRRLQTTGHILEWLCFSLSDEQLRDPRIVRSVRYTTDLLLNERDHAWEVGHLGHALHALQLYNERVFGGPIRSYEGLVLKRSVKTTRPSQPAATTADGSFRSVIGIR